MRINATLASVVGAGVGLVAAGATYAATAGNASDASPVSASAPQAVTRTVVPTPPSRCSAHAVLTNGVCVVTIDHTTVLAPRVVSHTEDAARTTTAAHQKATARRTEQADPQDDANEQAQGDDQNGDGEHAEDGDDRGEHAEPGDDGGSEHGDDGHDDGGDDGGHDGGHDD